MKYMGSKNRIAKHILPIILKDRKEGQWYVEPFVGGANMIDKVDGNRLGADINEYLIALLRSMACDWKPPMSLSEEEFNAIKEDPSKFPRDLVGYAAFQLSYGAMWFGSYRRDSVGKRDYAQEAYRNVVKQAPKLYGAYFRLSSYDELEIPNESIIYCDPPYANTAKYKGNDSELDHDKFWQWCREKSRQGHTVFVSEYNAPDDFECVWEKEINSSLTKDTGGKKAKEKLFRVMG